MNTKTHKKLCWNCDGYVHIYEIQCPYCAADLSDYACDKAKERNAPLSDSIEEVKEKIQEEVPKPAYQSSYGHFEELPKHIESAPKEFEIKEEKDVENPLAALLLLLPGSVLFLLGLSMILFSGDGYLTFKFKSKFWYFYLVGSLPLLLLGYRALFSNKQVEKRVSTNRIRNSYPDKPY